MNITRVLVPYVGLESKRVVQALKALEIDSVLAVPLDQTTPNWSSEAGFVAFYSDQNFSGLISAAMDSGCDAIYDLNKTEMSALKLSSFCSTARIGYMNGSPEVLATLMNRVGIRWAASDLHMSVVTTSEKIESYEDGLYWLIQLGLPLVLRTLREPSQKLFTEEEVQIALKESLKDGPVVLERLLEDVREIETVMFSDGENLPICLGEGDFSLRVDRERVLSEFPPQGLSDSELNKLRSQAAQLIIGTGWKGIISARFLVTNDGRAYFLQLNPGLKPWHWAVEHSLEVDLYEALIRVLAGDELGWKQNDIWFNGHTISLLIRSASSGRIAKLQLPRNIRIYWGPNQGDSVVKGELIGSISIKGKSRQAAIVLAKVALDEL
ncbi:MAG: hypothetical protein VX278_06185, partial [Myxococcota bacterium]|nr:hypothetical protein [Myxococcota bacterium]